MTLVSKTQSLFNRTRNDLLSTNTSALAEAEEYKYNYSGLDKEVAKTLRNVTCDIRRRSLHLAIEIATIGKKLIEVKEMLPHGEFLNWIDKEFTQPGYFTAAAARNYMNAYSFLQEYKNVKNLLNNLPLGALYIAARSSLPEDVKEEIVQSAKYYKLTRTEVSRIIALFKETEQEISIEEDENVPCIDKSRYDKSTINIASKLVDVIEVNVNKVETKPDVNKRVAEPTKVSELPIFQSVGVTLDNIEIETIIEPPQPVSSIFQLPALCNTIIYQSNLVDTTFNKEISENNLREIKTKMTAKSIGIVIARADTLSYFISILNKLYFHTVCVSAFRRNSRIIIQSEHFTYGSHILFAIIFSKNKAIELNSINDYVQNNKIGILHYIFELVDSEHENQIAWVVEKTDSTNNENQLDLCLDDDQLKLLTDKYQNFVTI